MIAALECHPDLSGSEFGETESDAIDGSQRFVAVREMMIEDDRKVSLLPRRTDGISTERVHTQDRSGLSEEASFEGKETPAQRSLVTWRRKQSPEERSAGRCIEIAEHGHHRRRRDQVLDGETGAIIEVEFGGSIPTTSTRKRLSSARASAYEIGPVPATLSR